jgi:hypothetical protein
MQFAMAFHDKLLAGTNRLAHAFGPGPVRAEDRGPEDDRAGIIGHRSVDIDFLDPGVVLHAVTFG